MCDISPLGLMVAERAGLPSVLVENFTWDWLYAPLVAQDPAFGPIVDWMRARFARQASAFRLGRGAIPW